MKNYSINTVNFSKYKLVIFDLDNTLYNENTYLFEVYKEIANYMYVKYNISKETSYFFLKETFLKEGRSKLLNKFCNKFSISNQEIKPCLHIMRTIKLSNKLILFPDIEEKLNESLKSTNVCVITNGNPIQQKNKVAQINWRNINLEKIYYANEIKPKPSPQLFNEKIKKDYKLESNDKILMIGDSDVDREFAKNIQSDFVFITS